MGYRPGLDGIRGIAILLVLTWHAWVVPYPPVGTAGVTLFFVLSGYLITRLLLEERARSGTIDLAAFWTRRAVRLLPALVLMVALTLPFRLDQWWSAGWALSYVGNWWWAAGNDSGMYGFTWSLAIEEQFYLVWPVLILMSLRLRLVIVALVVLLALRLVPQSGEFANFSTLSHAPSILIGAALAYRPIERRIPPVRLAIAAAATVLGYLALVLTGIGLDMQLIAAFGAMLVITGMAGSFTWRPLVALGRISYGVYLWHLPVMVILGAEYGARGVAVGVLASAVAIAIAALSYRLVEQPLLAMRRRRQEVRAPASASLASVAEIAPGSRNVMS